MGRSSGTWSVVKTVVNVRSGLTQHSYPQGKPQAPEYHKHILSRSTLPGRPNGYNIGSGDVGASTDGRGATVVRLLLMTSLACILRLGRDLWVVLH